MGSNIVCTVSFIYNIQLLWRPSNAILPPTDEAAVVGTDLHISDDKIFTAIDSEN